MDLDDLHIFRCVVREGGVTRAAHHLHRVPSNVTTRIKQLEERLGMALFRREGRSLTLTEAGRTLLGHAEKLLQMADLAEEELRSGIVRGVLRLGSLESAAGARLPPILSAFHAQNPHVTIELQTGTTRAMLRQLERYEVEAAFVSEPFERGNLSSVPAFDEELVLITGRGVPTIRQASELGGRTLVAFPHGCSYRQRLIEWLAEGNVLPERVLEMSSYYAIVACVAAGTGAAIVPAEVLDHAVLSTAVERHPLPPRFRVNRTHLVWSDCASAPLQALMALLPSAGIAEQAA
ncbi:LysR family transcriptional regulator [Methylobacterium gnaphalii]|uniref:LysR family transcriptional regulator n=1 Tax=Methylobacterium gnaphalii TaxID=1010610 RepID=A0A512JQ99_9HYPH|nr:LysR family transcriptional regulator [Methylobacterium gnaphalii]GEP12140.1 LysR family transcriptional regulator [Methylobacterium gnaphalii]GJD70004.1 HTH-type transcriptional regulator GltR [Methylobacterium gnaphalii]GLS48899.1 LysR family transcriptional regulator [Methylobacterium gnaphalii]